MSKQLLHHLRLIISGIAGASLFALLPAEWTVLTRVLVSWNVFALLFQFLVYRLMMKLNARQLTEKYKEEDETAPVILIISIVGAVLAVASVVAFLSSLPDVSGLNKALHIALAVLTVIESWILIPTMFTLHYADMYYSAEPNSRPLNFPQTDGPVFVDFAYFSFTIAAACQTADVSTAQGTIRKVVLAQTILSFFFNASILGFSINVMAGLIGK